MPFDSLLASDQPAPAVGRVAAHADDCHGLVVVGVDGSAGSVAAVRWAANEASRRKALLRIVTAWEIPAAILHEQPSANGAKAAATLLQEALDGLVRRQCDLGRVVCAIRPGNPAVVLEHEARSADLLVLGTGNDPTAAGPGRTILHCIRHVRTPLVVISAPWVF